MNQHHIEAEEELLSIILQNPEKIDEVTIDPEMLLEVNKAVIKTMLDLKSKGKEITVLTIFDRVGERNIHRVGGIQYLSKLGGAMSSVRNFDHVQEQIVQHYQSREAQKIGMQMAGGLDPVKAQKALNELMETRNVRRTGDIRPALTRVYNRVVLGEGKIESILFGFRDLDKITNGAKPGNLIIIAARPSMGKTAFALNIVENVAGSRQNPEGAVVAFFSGETTTDDLMMRAIAAKGHLDMMDMQHAQEVYTQREFDTFSKMVGLLSETDLEVFDLPGFDMNYIISCSRDLKRRNPGRKVMIVIDYLQLIAGDPKHRGIKKDEVGASSRALKVLALELECPVIALSQLSRGVEQRQDKRPMMSDIKESGDVEQDADIIAFLYREDYYDKESEDKNMVEVIIAKQRNGPTGNVKMAFVREYGKFVNIDWSGHAATSPASNRTKVTKLGHVDDPEPLTD